MGRRGIDTAAEEGDGRGGPGAAAWLLAWEPRGLTEVARDDPEEEEPPIEPPQKLRRVVNRLRSQQPLASPAPVALVSLVAAPRVLSSEALGICGSDASSPVGEPRPSPQPPAGKLDVYAVPLTTASEELRRSAETLLHAAWCNDPSAKLVISIALGLTLNGMSLRSGSRTARCLRSPQGNSKRGDAHWLVWEETQPSKHFVGAMILSRTGCPGSGAVSIDYMAARRGQGGRGFPMVLAAEAVCKQEGFNELYSAADLSQLGQGADPPGSNSAADAHSRWGFKKITKKEWEAAGLTLYDASKCSVRYTRKRLSPPSSAGAKASTTAGRAGSSASAGSAPVLRSRRSRPS